MRSTKPRVITTFDLFVVVVVLGYFLGIVQSAVRDDGSRVRFTPSSQLPRDSMPAERSAGAELTLLPLAPDVATN